MSTDDIESVSSDLTNLIFKRGQLKGQLTRFQNFLNSCNNGEASITEVETRLARIQNILDKFEDIQCNIEISTGNVIQEDERDSFENMFHKVNAEAKKLLNPQNNVVFSNTAQPVQPTIDTVNTNLQQINIQGQVKLPNISLPDFQGHYDEWITFHDTFVNIIHENQQLSKIQKFYYLRSCLKGEAVQTVHSLKITNDNYEIAWSLLKERYENKKLIINTHMKAIFDLYPVKNESQTQLRKLLDNFNKNYRALTALGQPTDKWDTPMICTLTSKLDPVSKKEWEQYISKDDVDAITTKKLTDFLSQRCQLLETIENKHRGGKTSSEKSYLHISTQKIKCSFCKQNHFNQNCEQFLKMSVSSRLAEVKRNKLCLNCLRPNHFTSECRSSTCRHCNRKHHSFLHNSESTSQLPLNSNARNNFTDTPENTEVPSTSITCTTSVANHAMHSYKNDMGSSQVLLATAIVNICNFEGKQIPCRALLDSGSQSNFITSSLVKKLNLNTTHIQIPVAGVNNLLSNISNKTVTTIFSRDNKYKSNEMFLLVNKITDSLPQISFDIFDLQLPDGIELADENLNKSKPIDLLLGAKVFFEVLCDGQIKFGRNSPVIQRTKLGWIVSGSINLQNTQHSILCNLAISNNDLHNQVKQFWTLEEINTEKVHCSKEENECEQHFLQTFKRDKNNRFEVSLPLKDNFVDLGNSEDIAIKRFNLLEKRLQNNINLKTQYVKFMEDYETLGHMTQIDITLDNSEGIKYYLPHHGVFKENSTTTKLRVVFDASCKTSSGLSLNDVLKVGPTIQRDLFSIALKLRKHNVVFIGDIEKMYRQINIAHEHRDFQRIVWRAEPSEELKHFRLNTLTYGTGPASFLACRVLYQVAVENQINYPKACDTIKHDFYMDDLITGADNVKEALILKNEITEILNSAGLPLRKWCSNRTELLDCQHLGNLPEYYISKDEHIKALGLVWNPNNDTFSYTVNLPKYTTVTKRLILSAFSKIFDPLGLIGPTTVQAKLILQKLWQTQISWDEAIPLDLFTVWTQFYESLCQI